MTSRAMANSAEREVQAYYETLGYKTDRARNQVVVGPGGRPFSISYDFLGAFDIIGIGPLGVLFSQITMSESNLSRKRSGVDEMPWPTPHPLLVNTPEAKAGMALIRAEVVYVERVNHPDDKRRKAWRMTFQRYDPVTKTWPRRGTDGVDYILWCDGKVLPQVML